MEERSELSVVIDGKVYRLSGGSDIYLQKLASYVDGKIRELKKQPGYNKLSTEYRDILLALETEYRALYARSLTLGRLSEAVILPLCPDKGGCMTYDINRAASTYLEGDIELLKRMKSIH